LLLKKNNLKRPVLHILSRREYKYNRKGKRKKSFGKPLSKKE